MDKQKTWWAPVWKGLVTDPDARHYRRMKSAVWLYVYLLLNADRRTGFLSRKFITISKDMGLSQGAVKRWMTILRKGGYVATKSNGHSLTIRVNKWRSIQGIRNVSQQESQISDPRRRGFQTLREALNGRLKADTSPKMLRPP